MSTKNNDNLPSLSTAPGGDFEQWAKDYADKIFQDNPVSFRAHISAECYAAQMAAYDFLRLQKSTIAFLVGKAGGIWVKASERLPKEAGGHNSVIIKGTGFGEDAFGHGYKHEFVTKGFKNFGKEPKFYFFIGNQNFLTNENIEWLDEFPKHARPGEAYTREEVKQIAKDCTRLFCGLPSEFDKYFDESYSAKTESVGEPEAIDRLTDMLSRAESYLLELKDQDTHDPSVGLYRDAHLVELVDDIGNYFHNKDRPECTKIEWLEEIHRGKQCKIDELGKNKNDLYDTLKDMLSNVKNKINERSYMEAIQLIDDKLASL